MIKFSSHSGINTLKVSQELDITLDEAWDFFSNPKNLSEIYKDDFVKLRDERDAKLAMPKLIVPSLQVNMRAGNMPEPDEQGDVFIKVPINKM